MGSPKPGLGRNSLNSQSMQCQLQKLFAHNFGKMLNAKWMFLIFLLSWLLNVMGNDVYDLREWRNVWILETEGFNWTPRKSVCRAGSVLGSTFQPFSSFLSSLSAQGEKHVFTDRHPHTSSRLEGSQCLGGLQPCGQSGFYWPCVSSGEVIQLCQQGKSFWCPLVVSPLEGSVNIAVV